MSSGAMLVWLATLWLYAGGAIAAVFLLFGIDRVEEDARGAYLFRPLLVPGVLLLWPLVLWRWWTLETISGAADDPGRYRAVRGSHARVWSVLAVLIPAVLIGALLMRQPVPDSKGAAVRLDAPAAKQ
jgi:hypothetical protein